MQWYERIESEINRLGWDRGRLSRAVELPLGTVHSHLQGKVAQPRGNIIARYAAALGVREWWLRTGEGERVAEALPDAGGLDTALLQEIIHLIEDQIDKTGHRPPPERYAQLISLCYQMETRITPSARTPLATILSAFKLFM